MFKQHSLNVAEEEAREAGEAAVITVHQAKLHKPWVSKA